MSGIKSIEITVLGCKPHVYHHRTLGKARAEAWRNFQAVSPECSFGEFLKSAFVRVVKAAPPVGERIFVLGKHATAISFTKRGDATFIYDGDDRKLMAHYSDVVRPSHSTGVGS